jgi:hypothetical protein
MTGQPDNRTAPPHIGASRSWPAPLVIALTSLVVVGAALLFLFDPARHAFYPVCLFKKMSGYDCPGCGGLRAVHHLLRGDVWGAFQLNAMAVIALPLLGLLALRVWWRSARGGARGGLPVLFWVWLGLAAIVLFGVIRNLPFWPFGVTPG